MQGWCAPCSKLRQRLAARASSASDHPRSLQRHLQAQHRRVLLPPVGARSPRQAPGPLPDALLQHLVQQASQELVVAVPQQPRPISDARSEPDPLLQSQARQQPLPAAHRTDRSTAARRPDVATPGSAAGPSWSAPQPWRSPQLEPPRQLRPAQPKPQPRLLEFEAMYTALQAWRRQYLSCHVPRHCFDAPELGSWVRHMRKEHKEGRLEQWKVDRLNALGMEWHMTDADAKWHHCYHQLRRFKLVHGHTNIPSGYTDARDRDWEMVSRWLERQGRLLAKEHLPEQRRRMLAALGVTLRVPEELLQRYSRLRGMNGHERKLERRRWKAKRLAADEAREEEQGREQAREAEEAKRLQHEQELRKWILQQQPQRQQPLPPAQQQLQQLDEPRQPMQAAEQQPTMHQEQQQQQQQQQHLERGTPAGIILGSSERLFGLNSQGRRRGKGRTREERWLAQGSDFQLQFEPMQKQQEERLQLGQLLGPQQHTTIAVDAPELQPSDPVAPMHNIADTW